MATVLLINASTRPRDSYSFKTAEAFIESYLVAHPGDTVRTLDLSENVIPDFDALAVSGKYRILHDESNTSEEAQAWKAVKAVIDDFKSADKIVIASPMWNFGIPYRLKQLIDVIVQPGHTFSYSPEKGYSGLVTGRPATLILARGGEYPAGTDAAAYDFQRPYLEGILRFIGFEDIDTIVVEPTLQGGSEVAEMKLAEAIATARDKAKAF